MSVNNDICTRFLKVFDMVCAEHSFKADELARKIGTTGVYISQLRKQTNPHIRPDILAELSRMFNVSPEYLLLGTGEIKSEPYDIREAIKRIEHSQGEVIAKLLDALIYAGPPKDDPLTSLFRKKSN